MEVLLYLDELAGSNPAMMTLVNRVLKRGHQGDSGRGRGLPGAASSGRGNNKKKAKTGDADADEDQDGDCQDGAEGDPRFKSRILRIP